MFCFRVGSSSSSSGGMVVELDSSLSTNGMQLELVVPCQQTVEDSWVTCLSTGNGAPSGATRSTAAGR